MNSRVACVSVFLALVLVCLELRQKSSGTVSVTLPAYAAARGLPVAPRFDPLRVLENVFPGSVTTRQKGRLIEFCPDNTCDGFLSPKQVSVDTVRNFAYLYEYFFSKYSYLQAWRSRPDARSAAARVLAGPQYRSCRAGNARDKARCILLHLSANKRIKPLSIRYDEGHRDVVVEDLGKELSASHSPHKR